MEGLKKISGEVRIVSTAIVSRFCVDNERDISQFDTRLYSARIARARYRLLFPRIPPFVTVNVTEKRRAKSEEV